MEMKLFDPFTVWPFKYNKSVLLLDHGLGNYEPAQKGA